MIDVFILILTAVMITLVILAMQIDSNHNEAIQLACEIARENARNGVAVTLPKLCF